jgi:hypothetical protein
MSLSRQEEQAERRRVFAQDQSTPNQATTMHQFAQADAQTPRGRFTAHEQSTVVGAQPTVNYPAGPAWSADPGSQCDEPPLGLDNSEPLAVEPAGSSLSQSGDPAVVSFPSPPVTSSDVKVGRQSTVAFEEERMAEIVSMKTKESWDTDLFDTLVAAARWEKIAGLVARSGKQVLFDDYETRHGRNDGAFMLAKTENCVQFLGDLYDFVSNQTQRKELRKLIRQIIAGPPFREGGPLSEMVWPLKQRIDEYDMLARYGFEPPDGENDA